MHRFTQSADGKWSPQSLDANESLPEGAITSIVVDPTDTTRASIFVAIGGTGGQRRHVWRYDGRRRQWEHRSEGLPSIQFNALAVDPRSGTSIYAACDIGVWRSSNSGASWMSFSRGLPDAAVLDLQFHPTHRVLRAGTYGRGVFEHFLGERRSSAAELYVRRSILDRGVRDADVGGHDPRQPGVSVSNRLSPDIRVAHGSVARTAPDYLWFSYVLPGEAADVVTPHGETFVYVQVHNRASQPQTAHVTLLAAPVAAISADLPGLPDDFVEALRSGATEWQAPWSHVGRRQLSGVAVQMPLVAEFALDMLSAADGAVCLVAIVDSDDDPFESDAADLSSVVAVNRKIACRVVQVKAG